MSEIFAIPSGLERIERAKSLNNIRVALRDIVHAFDVEHAAYCGIPPLAEGATQSWIVLATYPDAWLRHYATADDFRIDPVVQAVRRAIAPIDWRDVEVLEPAAAKLFKEAREFGVAGQGLSFPIRGPGGDSGIFTVSANVSDTAWDALKGRRLFDWMSLGHAIHRRTTDIDPAHMRGGLGRLSPRERDILEQTAQGLTSDEVAKAFGISERVVRGYLQACRNKLNAQNSTHAVARAVKLGLVCAG